MRLLPVISRHLDYMIWQMVDSQLETTRIFWRQKYFEATDEEARDPRPFVDILKERRQ